MGRWTKRTLFGIAISLIGAALTGVLYQWATTRKELAATPPPGRLVAIDGHRLHLSCTGNGEPTVLLETGLGGSTADWGFVQPNVAQFTRVCSYDRAGMGYSDPGPSPRTAERIARELAQLLDRSGIKGPLVLVAASIGAFPVRVFASHYGDRVAALVLVDASHENQEHAIPDLARFVPVLSSIGILRLAGISFGPPPAALAPSAREFAEATRFRTTSQRATADEIVHVRESAAQVAATRRNLSIPVIVVTAGRGADATWLDLQRDLVALSQRGCQIITKQSGHAILLEEPAVVVSAIRTAVHAIRGSHNVSAQQCELQD
jgi:pimeloyl-ACP methyl ester carboxylesterase